MATMKSEALAHYHERHGVPLRTRLFANVRTLNRWGSACAPLSNLPGALHPLRVVLDKALGIDRRRPLPAFQRETLQRWFRRRRGSATAGSNGSAQPRRGRVIFLADSFTSYTEPEIGRAAIELLEAAGWSVDLVDDVCCGRAHLSKGLLNQARALHADLLERLAPEARSGSLIVGCEPSCLLTLREEIPALAGHSADAQVVARQARLADDLLADALADGTLVPDRNAAAAPPRIVFHGHCHQKAGGALGSSVKLLTGIPGAEVDVLDAGCCGMAGSFGFEREHYEISMKIARLRLVPALEAATADTLVAATGASCRQQIAHGTDRIARHPIVLLRSAVALG
jgi:Fe-S oxidoreductase